MEAIANNTIEIAKIVRISQRATAQWVILVGVILYFLLR
jgi:hypothetical protein